MTNAEHIAQKLVYLRKKKGLSQEELADHLSVSRQAVSKWERGETLPDTDNLISIAKLFSVSLDELVGNDNVKTENDTSSQNDENPIETEVRVDTDDGNGNVNADSTENDITENINGDNDEDENDTDYEVDEVDDNGDNKSDVYYSYASPSNGKKHVVLALFQNLPFPIIVTIAFLLWGFLYDGWYVAWTLFITIPAYYSLVDCFKHKKVSNFAYPFLIAFIYCLLGMQWGLWHPYWILFLTIPIFYPIANTIDKK